MLRRPQKERGGCTLAVTKEEQKRAERGPSQPASQRSVPSEDLKGPRGRKRYGNRKRGITAKRQGAVTPARGNSEGFWRDIGREKEDAKKGAIKNLLIDKWRPEEGYGRNTHVG